MAEKKNWSVLLAMVLVFAVTVVGCGDNPSDEGGRTINFHGVDATGDTYILVITENTSGRTAYSPQIGDSYVLTIKIPNQPDKVSSGTISNIGTDGHTLVLQPSTVGSATFSVTIRGDTISEITGTITLNAGGTVAGPGAFYNSSGNGIFTLTGIPSTYNGKYVYLSQSTAMPPPDELIFGFQSINANTLKITLCSISNGTVNLPLWKMKIGEAYTRYSGNDTIILSIAILNSQTFSESDLASAIGIFVFSSVTFSNGCAEKSWSDGQSISINP